MVENNRKPVDCSRSGLALLPLALLRVRNLVQVEKYTTVLQYKRKWFNFSTLTLALCHTQAPFRKKTGFLEVFLGFVLKYPSISGMLFPFHPGVHGL